MAYAAIFLTMKTEARLFVKLHVLANNFIVFFVVSFGITTLYTLLDHMPGHDDIGDRKINDQSCHVHQGGDERS